MGVRTNEWPRLSSSSIPSYCMFHSLTVKLDPKPHTLFLSMFYVTFFFWDDVLVLEPPDTCHFCSFKVHQYLGAGKVKVLVTQSCLTLCDPMDYSPPGSSVHGILHSRIQEWVAIPFSRRSSRSRNWIWVSCISGSFFTIWATREALGVKKETPLLPRLSLEGSESRRWLSCVDDFYPSSFSLICCGENISGFSILL